MSEMFPEYQVIYMDDGIAVKHWGIQVCFVTLGIGAPSPFYPFISWAREPAPFSPWSDEALVLARLRKELDSLP